MTITLQRLIFPRNIMRSIPFTDSKGDIWFKLAYGTNFELPEETIPPWKLFISSFLKQHFGTIEWATASCLLSLNNNGILFVR